MCAKGLLLKRFLHNPARIGAVAASGPVLCCELVTWLEADKAEAIAELGPGTGAVTREVIRQKSPDTKFFAVELDPEIYRELHKNMPELKLFNANACDLSDLCRQENIEKLNAVVSGLPWATFPEKLQRSVLSAITQSLVSGGKFTTFAYLQGLLMPGGQRFRKLLNEYFSSVTASRVIWRNLPPAITYRCIK